jgi:hypothetical protein
MIANGDVCRAIAISIAQTGNTDAECETEHRRV